MMLRPLLLRRRFLPRSLPKYDNGVQFRVPALGLPVWNWAISRKLDNFGRSFQQRNERSHSTHAAAAAVLTVRRGCCWLRWQGFGLEILRLDEQKWNQQRGRTKCVPISELSGGWFVWLRGVVRRQHNWRPPAASEKMAGAVDELLPVTIIKPNNEWLIVAMKLNRQLFGDVDELWWNLIATWDVIMTTTGWILIWLPSIQFQLRVW